MKYYIYVLIALLASCTFSATIEDDEEKKQYDMSIERLEP